MKKIDESILGKSLNLVYKPLLGKSLDKILDKIFQKRIGLLYSTSRNLLKLTNILLEKFN